jgi:recombinational DNA repair ATPase RecF
MGIQKILLTNFTVFEELEIEFCQGINIFIGENGTGKTHLMKLLYAACKAMHPKVSFSQKIVQTFRPDDFSIGRLVKRKPGYRPQQ